MTFKHCFLTTGVGNHPEKLISFELALRNAGRGPQGIAPYNWIFVNSILPPKCQLISKEEGLVLLNERHEVGDPAYMVLSKTQTCNPQEVVYASIGASRYSLTHMTNLGHMGYLAEYGYIDRNHMIGVEDHVRDMVTSYARFMLHTLIGEAEINWSERGMDFERIEHTIPTVIESAVASNTPKNTGGVFTEWATAIACAVFIPA